MAARKKSPQIPPTASSAGRPIRELKAFYHHQPSDPVSTSRFYWAKGEGERESIVPVFIAKRRPASPGSDVDTAARVEALLPRDVSDEFSNPDFLVASYQAKLPPEETSAFAQVKLAFPAAINLHHPWEEARSWLRSYFVDRLGVPVLAILHAPFLAGSEAPVHIHGLVLTRRLGAFGWTGCHRDLAGDAGLAAAEKSWLSANIR